MNESHNRGEHAHSQNLQVWYCDHCRSVHFKTANVMLNFSKNEFAELTRTMLEIYSSEIGASEFHNLLGSLNTEDEILLSETVS